MAPSSLLSILSLALISLLSVSVTPANALSIHHTSHDQAVRAHAVISARRDVLSKRSNSKRCSPKQAKPVSSSSAKPAPTTTKQTQTQTTASQPTKSSGSTKSTSSGGNSGSNSGSSNSGSSNSGSSNSGSSNSGSSNSGSSNSGSSSSSPPPSNGGGAFNFAGKAGLAWPNGDANNLAAWKGSKTGFLYTWSAEKPSNADQLGFTFAPMLWGWNNVDDFKSKTVAGYAKIALGMNECNEVGQSNMDPTSGVQLWREAMLPLADKGYTLVSPAMSSRPNGKDWMQTFMANCQDCKVSAIAVHWYGTDLDDFKNYVTYWYTTYKLPVLITEYADQNFSGGAQATSDEVWAFMEGATQWINSQDWIKVHCWFGAMQQMQGVNTFNKLMNDAGNAPNDLGYYFINN